MSSPDDPGSVAEDTLTGDDKIIAEAKRRFKMCEQWESAARQRYRDDLKFVNADADNGYQWPNKILTDRQISSRPSLTINKTREHCLQIINDAKQNKPGVSIRPVGNGATYEAAQVFEGIVRHIEYISNASSAYDVATTFQVQCGIGYWRIVTDFAHDDTFDQEIFIRPVADPLSIYLDMDIKEADASDMRYAFVFEDVPKDKFKREYKDYQQFASRAPLGNTSDGWVSTDYVRVAEYYRVSETPDKLLALRDPETGEVTEIRASTIPKEILDQVMDADPEMKTRPISNPRIEWYKIAGDEIIDRTIVLGRYIPIVRVIGEETIINGELDRKGHTRALIDPQRIYNYWSSAAVEQIALQSKTPYIAPVRSIEGYETYWRTANTENYSVLPYNDMDDKGQPVAAPTRAEAPMLAPAYIEGLRIAAEQMQMVSGQYDAQMGAPSNERSGKAIAERQRQGDNSTYHYIDNLSMAIRRTGKILIDLIPKVYDTPRVMRILAEDGTDTEVQLDPQARAAFLQQRQQEGQSVKSIFNPNVGYYDVEADVGPGYATKRQEAWNAFTQIAAQNPELMNMIGDLMFKSADFPGAEEIAERFDEMRKGPPPQVLQAQQAVAGLQKTVETLVQQLGEEKLKVKAKDQQKDIDVYEAVTDRIKVMLPTILNPAEIAHMVHDLAMQEHAAQLQQVTAASAPDLAKDAQEGAGSPSVVEPGEPDQPPVPGAQQGPDGQWYVPDPNRAGKHMRIAA